MWKVILLILVSYGALANTPCGDELLARAISEDSTASIQNCDPISSKINGLSPLMVALKYGREELSLYLVERGVSLVKPFKSGDTPMTFIAKRGNFSLSFIEKLASLGADFKRPSRSGRTPLMEAVISGNFELIHFLLQNGVSIDRPDREGKAALYYAVENHRYDLVELFVDRGAKFSSVRLREDGKSITTSFAHVAARLDNLRSLGFFLDMGVDPSGLDSLGRSPLAIAIQSEHAQAMIESLLSAGASKEKIGNDNKTMLYYAIEFDRIDLIDYIVDKFGERPSSQLSTAVELNNQRALEYLLSVGARPWAQALYISAGDATLINPQNPIAKAVELGRYQMLKAMSQKRFHSELTAGSGNLLAFFAQTVLLSDDQEGSKAIRSLFPLIPSIESFYKEDIFYSIRSIEMMKFLSDEKLLYPVLADEGFAKVTFSKSAGRITSYFVVSESNFSKIRGIKSKFGAYASIGMQVEVFGKSMFGKRKRLTSKRANLTRQSDSQSFFRYQGKITDIIVSASISDKGITIPLYRVSCNGSRCTKLD